MQYDNLLVEEREGIILLTINREKALNALNTQTMLELFQFFSSDYSKSDHIKGIVITGAGDRAFVAGADIKEFLDLDPKKGAEMAKRGHDIFFMIEQFPKPVVAAIHGFALGGGCELAMACHLRVATPEARFGQPEVNLGIVPGYGGTQRLIQYLGKTRAMEYLMTADLFDAHQALSWGLLNHVVPRESLLDTAFGLIQKIASKGPVAISKIIELVNVYFSNPGEGFARELEAFGATTGTRDFREGASAFIEKRPAKFTGK